MRLLGLGVSRVSINMVRRCAKSSRSGLLRWLVDRVRSGSTAMVASRRFLTHATARRAIGTATAARYRLAERRGVNFPC
jgi:hypothetical protein